MDCLFEECFLTGFPVPQLTNSQQPSILKETGSGGRKYGFI